MCSLQWIFFFIQINQRVVWNSNLLFIFTDSQLAGHEATGSYCCQSLHSERLYQRHCVPVPNQVPLWPGDQGRIHFFSIVQNVLFHSELIEWLMCFMTIIFILWMMWYDLVFRTTLQRTVTCCYYDLLLYTVILCIQSQILHLLGHKISTSHQWNAGKICKWLVDFLHLPAKKQW